MNRQNEHLETLTEIRSLMERSSKFLSLSGLSGIAAGTIALIGAIVAYLYFSMDLFQLATPVTPNGSRGNFSYREHYTNWDLDAISFLLIDGISVLILAIVFGFYFSARKAKRKGYKFWDNTTKRWLINLLIPLVAGGIFSLIVLFKYHLIGLIPSVTLIFYGLGLLNAGKYTLEEVRYLGISEIVLGLIACWFIEYSLLFWAIGFGVLHIVYGTLMYIKYDR